MIQPLANKQGRNRRLNVFAVLLTAIFVNLLFLASVAAAGPLCMEELGPYYVNVGVGNDSFGMGMDDAFEATVQRVRPRTEEDVNRLKSFFYAEGKDARGELYSDNRQYLWQKEGREYRLVKKVAGRKPVRLDLFTVTFPHIKKQQFLMRLMNSNPRLYTELKLASKLDVLGVMAVSFRGRTGTVEFINNLKVDNSGTLPRAYTANADVMLYRFAREAGYDGASTEIERLEWQDPRVMSIVLSKKSEQYFLDNLDQFFQGSGLTDDIEALMGKFGDLKVPYGIGKADIRYFFLNCSASGENTYGSPKSVFIPVKMQEGDKSFYPVFIFPAAFGTVDTLYVELRKAALHARWWNAVANLVNGPEEKELREVLLRASIPYIELNIARTPTPGITAGTAEFNVNVSLQPILVSAVESALNDIGVSDYAIPWTVDSRLIMLEGSGNRSTAAAEGYYNKLIMRYMRDVTNFKNSKKFVEPKQKLDARLLASAIANGYTLTAAERTAALKMALDGAEKDFMALVEDAVNRLRKERPALTVTQPKAFSGIMEYIRVNEYIYDDLDWLARLTETKMNLEKLGKDKIGLRLAVLASKLKEKNLKNLDLAMARPILRNEVPAQDQLEDMLKNVEKLVTQTRTQVDTLGDGFELAKQILDSKKNEAEQIKAKLPQQYKELKEVEEKAEELRLLSEKELNEAYLEMTKSCSKTPSRDEQAEVLSSNYQIWPSADCGPSINAFVQARKEYAQKAAPINEEITASTENIHNILNEILSLNEPVMNMRQLYNLGSNDNVTHFTTIARLNNNMKEKTFTWKSWIINAFTDYFLSDDATIHAFNKLETNLGKAGVVIENKQ